MTERCFTVGELKKLISESSNEFKPKLGKNVEKDNKLNNEKSYKENEKKIKVKNKVEREDLPEKIDPNKTTLDYNPRIEPSDKYKERIKAQALGYTSELEMNNGIEKSDDYEGNKKIYKQFVDASKKQNDRFADITHTGLQSRMRDKSEFERNSLYEKKELKPKRLIFKHTKFVNESQVLSRIPEEYKNDGQIIHMCDKFDNVYIVECVKSEKSGKIETNIISHSNKTLMNEQMSRIQDLINFKSNVNERYNQVSENENFNEILKINRNK